MNLILASPCFFSNFRHPRRRLWAIKLKTWSLQIRFYALVFWPSNLKAILIYHAVDQPTFTTYWVIELSVHLLYNCTVGRCWTENPYFMSIVQLLTQFSFLVSKRQSPEMNCKLVLQRSNSTNIKIFGVPDVVLNITHTKKLITC